MLNYRVHRVLKMTDGTTVCVPVGYFQHKDDAERLAKELQQNMVMVLGCDVVKVNKNEAVPVGVSVAQFMKDLGLAGFNHFVQPVEVQGTLMMPSEDASRIILPS